MGQPMAGKLMDAGHSLVVFDISEAAMAPLLLRQARRAASPRDLGDQCEIVAVSLPTLGAFRAAVLGPDGLAAGSAIKVLLNTCTVGVPFLREVEAALAPNGIIIVDCPISGGPDADHCRQQTRRGAGLEAYQQHSVCSLACRDIRSVRDGRQGRA